MKRYLLLMDWKSIFSFLVFIPVSGWAVVYVDIDNAAGPWDGKSWATAYKTVQEGIDTAEKAGGGDVWVAEGIYKPTSAADRTGSFQLKSGVALYGGFKGTEAVREQRDWVTNVTILSGDIGKPGDNSDNSYHVVVGADNATIDGFTVTGGNGMRESRQGPQSRTGRQGGMGQQPGMRPQGGIRPQSGMGQRPGIGPQSGEGQRQIHITPNIVLSGANQGQGAGMLNYQCAPIVRNCIFKENYAVKGGGMYNMVRKNGFRPGGSGSSVPAPVITNCTFIGNYSFVRGGGVSNDLGTHPTFTNCNFINNSTDGKGGGMYNDFGCSPTVTNCVFAGNSAFRAGAMGNDGGSSPIVTNCTFTGNYASDLGASLYQGTGPANNPIVTNCIIWGNITPNGPKGIVNWHDCNPMVTYSCIEGRYSGAGNIDADPLFVDAKNGDYRLGRGSPCIDAGDGSAAPETDKDGNPRYDDRGIPDGSAAVAPGFGTSFGGSRQGPRSANVGSPADMGAYERQMDTEVPAQDVVYVSVDNIAGPWNGMSWPTAFQNIQEALDYAYASGSEVWIAEGTYKPTSTTDRTVSFQLRSGVIIYGGFKGNETGRDQRDWAANVTILSGDIGIPNNNKDNSYHVVVGADDATIDGFTITGGNADGATYHSKGGGMVNYVFSSQSGPFGAAVGLSPAVINCTFTKNYAVEGGAMYNYDRCTPELTKCTFIENSADNGGAVVDRVGANTVLNNCTFTKNYAKWRGGAVYIDYGSRPKISGCTFIENSTNGHGGSIYTLSRASQLEQTYPTISKCTFTRNRAELRGGGIANSDNSMIEVADCTFTQNYAGKGGGGISNDYRANAALTNCTFNGNSAGEGNADIDNDDSSSVTY